PAGIGKSRLRHELLRRIASREQPALLVQGRGEPIRTGSTYWLMGQALRPLFGFEANDDAPEQRRKLAARVPRHVPEPEAGRVSAFLGELCDLPFPDDDSVKAARQDPRLMREQVGRALSEFLHAESLRQPVLLVLEDLHWADRGSIDLVETAL